MNLSEHFTLEDTHWQTIQVTTKNSHFHLKHGQQHLMETFTLATKRIVNLGLINIMDGLLLTMVLQEGTLFQVKHGLQDHHHQTIHKHYHIGVKGYQQKTLNHMFTPVVLFMHL